MADQMSHKEMFNMQGHTFNHISRFEISDAAGEQWSSKQMTMAGKHTKGQEVLEKNLIKVRKEWMKVKEEIGHVKQRGEHLSETLMETDKKVGVMLVELDCVDKYVRYLMEQNDDLL